MEAHEVRALFDEGYAADYNEKFIFAEWPKHGADFEASVLSDLIDDETRWLDVGCGTGYFLSLFPGVARAGLDISPAMLDQARAANPDALFLREGSFLEDAPEWHGAWSLVSCIWQPYHYVQSIREVEQLVENMARWTAPGGACFIPILDLEDIWPFTVVPYRWEPGIWSGTIAITGITWTWYQGGGKVHEHSVAPHVEHFVEQLAPHFARVEILRYPPFRPGWVSRKAVLATARRANGDDRPAEIIRHDIPLDEGEEDHTEESVEHSPIEADAAPVEPAHSAGETAAGSGPLVADADADSSRAPGLNTVPVGQLIGEVLGRASPLRPRFWRSVRARSGRLVGRNRGDGR